MEHGTTVNSKKQNRITTDNTQKAKHVIRKDYPGAQSKTNTTLITLNQSQIMKLIRLKGTGTPRLWVIALRPRDCNLHCYLSGSLRCFYLHYCQSIIRAFRSEANDCQECSFYSFAIYFMAVHIEMCGLFQDRFAAVEFCQSNSSSLWDKHNSVHLQSPFIFSRDTAFISTSGQTKTKYLPTDASENIFIIIIFLFRQTNPLGNTWRWTAIYYHFHALVVNMLFPQY